MSGRLRLMLVGHGSTLGQAASDRAFRAAIEQYAGFDLVRATASPVRLHRALTRQPLADLAEAWSLRAAVRRAERLHGPSDVLVLPTTTAALLQPKRILVRSAVRFDALAAENRRGFKGLPSRLLERRYMRHVRLLLPYSALLLRDLPRHRYMRDRAVVPFPTPLEDSAAASRMRIRHRHRVVSYVGNPHKKGLDLVIRAWRDARLPADAELHLVGLTQQALDEYLDRAQLSLPEKVVVRGTITRPQFLDLLASASFYLAAARYEDFGIAPLEAMASGTCVVSAISEGPFEAAHLLRAIAPDLLTPLGDTAALARALERALALPAEERAHLADAARAAVKPYQAVRVLADTGPVLATSLQELAVTAGGRGLERQPSALLERRPPSTAGPAR